jgi:putative serine protease PepD
MSTPDPTTRLDSPQVPSGRWLVRPATAAIVAGTLLVGGAGLGFGAAGLRGEGATTTVRTVREPIDATTTPAASTSGGGLSVNEVSRRDSGGVVDVAVVTRDAAAGPFPLDLGEQTAQGSGVVYDSAGDIVTNAHVVAGARSIRVTFAEGETRSARLVGRDTSTDIAVIRVDPLPAGASALPFADSSAVDVGQGVLAIGSPFGLQGTVTSGIVSALHREISAPDGFPIEDAIQTDAAINHGNSGGALLDLAGRVIGITSQIRSDAGGSEGVGFAIPSNLVRTTADQIIATGHALHAYLGIGTATIPAAAASQLGEAAGVAVTQVHAGGPAQGAGLRQASGERAVAGDIYPTGGDVITALDGKRVTTSEDLQSAIAAHKPGDEVTLTVDDGTPRQVRLTLGTRPS